MSTLGWRKVDFVVLCHFPTRRHFTLKQLRKLLELQLHQRSYQRSHAKAGRLFLAYGPGATFSYSRHILDNRAPLWLGLGATGPRDADLAPVVNPTSSSGAQRQSPFFAAGDGGPPLFFPFRRTPFRPHSEPG